MSIYDLKPQFQKILRPVLLAAHKANITPNQITVISLLGSAITGLLCLRSPKNSLWLLTLPLWLIIRMALNALDGMLARSYNLQSRTGQVLNEIGDILSDILLYLPLIVVQREAIVPIVLFVVGALLTEFCGILGQAMGASRHYEGPMGKSDRAFFIGALMIMTVFFPTVLQHWRIIFLFGFSLTLVTSVNRILHFLKELRDA